MERLCHNVKINVFAKIDEGEDEEKLENALILLAGLKKEDMERIKLNKSTATGLEDKKIKIIELDLSKDKRIKAFLENIKKRLDTSQRETLWKQRESRLDCENHFFIRIDKEKLLNQKYKVVDHGNCFHINMTISCFPKNRENAMKNVEKILLR